MKQSKARESERLAERFRKMAAEEGLLDVKFFLSNGDEAATERVCQEVNQLYEAVDAGQLKELRFGDSNRK